jgi:hypothetical protein
MEVMDQLQRKYATAMANEYALALKNNPNVLKAESSLEATAQLIRSEIQKNMPPGYTITSLDTQSGTARAERTGPPTTPEKKDGQA